MRFVDSVASTNEALLNDRAAGEGDWLIARTQSGGRGRQGRQWQSLAGNFHGSTLIVAGPEQKSAPLLSLSCGIALFDAVAAAAPDAGLMLKWPNDLLLGTSKLAGILIERSGERMVAGFGVNLACAPNIDRPAASLAPVAMITPEAFAPLLAAAVSRAIAAWRTDPDAISRAWADRAHTLDTPLTVHPAADESVSGTFAGLDRDGALILRLADGSTRVIHAGDAILGEGGSYAARD